jgi:transglutaminase-like putative cysteine protease
MKHLIKHVTLYRYSTPASYAIQTLRLTPRADDHQRALRWHIAAPGLLEEQVDAYGNITHTLVINRPHGEIEIRVTGQIEIDPLDHGHVRGEESRLPLHAYCVPTALTRSDDNIGQLCRQVVPRGLHTPADLLVLAGAICDRVAYEPGFTDVTTAAAEVLALGHGVCQDHAHLFLACVRGLGAPARYVSGYHYALGGPTGDVAASHAWADVWLPEHGWVSVDVTNRALTSDSHCRLAVARDYDSASPVRGVRTGGGDESMSVSVQVQLAKQQ